MKPDAKIAIILSIIGTILWGMCLIVGIGMNDTATSFALGLAAVCFIIGALCVFWFGDEEDMEQSCELK